jgi:uncharacterized membrane protein YphA (DoxX/SURF4 family)
MGGIVTDPALPEVTVAIRALVALIFLAAALGKMRHWTVFPGVLANYGLLPDTLVAPVADLLPPVEALVGLLLLPGLAAPWPEIGAAVLLLIFAAAMAINLMRGRRDIDCGCFQSALKQHLTWTLVIRNVVLVSLLGIASLFPGSAGLSSTIEGLLVGGVLFIILQSLTILWGIVPAWRKAPERGTEVGS